MKKKAKKQTLKEKLKDKSYKRGWDAVGERYAKTKSKGK